MNSEGGNCGADTSVSSALDDASPAVLVEDF